MSKYFVYVKDPVVQQFWTVHVESSRSVHDALSWASAKTFGGCAIGLKEFFSNTPEDFVHDTVVPGMI